VKYLIFGGVFVISAIITFDVFNIFDFKLISTGKVLAGKTQNEIRLNTPTEEISPTITSSITLTVTPAISILSLTPTLNATPTLTLQPTLTSTLTPTKRPTNTLTPTLNPTITPTFKPTPTQTISLTSSPTPTTILIPKYSSQDINGFIDRFAGQYAVDPNVLRYIAICESGFNASAVNGPYVGLYQFGTSSWTTNRSIMGEDTNTSLRYNAEEAVQTAAYMISKGKQNQWPNCLP
jgi:hypothetical protein